MVGADPRAQKVRIAARQEEDIALFQTARGMAETVNHAFATGQRLIKAKRRYDPDNIFRSAIPLPVTAARAGAHDPLLDAAE